VESINGTDVPIPGTKGWTYEEAMYYGNLCMQILTAEFTYILSLTAPWRLGNVLHLWAKEFGLKRRCNAEGFDLYGRPTNGIWFWIPTRKRKLIVALLFGNLFFQYATQLCRILWPTYADSQTVLGAIFINFTFVSSIICGISSGSLQGNCEGQVRKEHPDKFPPTPLEHALKAWKETKEEEIRQGKPKRSSIRDVAMHRLSRLSCSDHSAGSGRPSFSQPFGQTTPLTSLDPDKEAAQRTLLSGSADGKAQPVVRTYATHL